MGELSASRIGVVTPYSAQVARIERELRSGCGEGAAAVEVSTVGCEQSAVTEPSTAGPSATARGGGGSSLHNHRIQAFSYDGTYQRLVCSRGSAPGQVVFPFDLASGDKRLYVAEHTGARVQVLSPEGKPLLLVPSPGGSRLGGVCAHGAHVYVVDTDQHQIQVYRAHT